MNKEKLLTYAHKGALAEWDYRVMQLERAKRGQNLVSVDFIEARLKELEEDIAEIEEEKRGLK